MENIITLDADADLIYSPDDGGWYLEKYLHDKHGTTLLSSEVFSNEKQALQAYRKNNVNWS